jgi:hypothetical protein
MLTTLNPDHRFASRSWMTEEIENPGLLPFGLTIEDILHGVSKLRNRVIGRVFSELHLIEQRG